jgi:hypothetical protein
MLLFRSRSAAPRQFSLSNGALPGSKHPVDNEQENAKNGKMHFLQLDPSFRTCEISRCDEHRMNLSGILS